MSAVESENPENYFEPRRYRVKCQCERCGHIYHSQWAKAPPLKDPPCPKRACRDAMILESAERENARLRQMLEEGKAPAHVGANTQVRAIDATANIVMKDYGMTDLKDNIRPGESAVAPLPPAQQKAADNYFGGGASPVIGQSRQKSLSQRQMDLIGRRAMAGGYARMAVPPTAIAPAAAKGQAPLVVKGVRSNDMYRGPRR